MARLVVGVLRGGTSSEYNLSLKTGAAMLQALPEERYEVRDILIDKHGMWHLRGQPATPARALAQLDVVLNALHGGIGEDGTIQRILERAGVAYAGSRALPSALTLNKIRAREILREAGVRMPRAVSFSHRNALASGDMAALVFAQFAPPYVVKPPADGAGRGVRVARTILELPDAIADTIESFGAALVEEFIRGEEASVGIIRDFRGEALYALPPARVASATPLSPEYHESGTLEHQVPSPFSHAQKLSLADLARLAHRSLGLGHYSRADLIVTPTRVYLLEVNTTPGLYSGASFPDMLEAVGSSIREFLEHAITLARTREESTVPVLSVRT